MHLDLTDKKLLYLLDQNCRESTTQLGKQLRIHRNVVLYRIKRLETAQVIRGYFAEINLNKIGCFTFRIFLKISNYSKADEEKLVTYLNNTSQLIWLFRVEGKWDFDLVFVAKTTKEFSEFLENLKENFNRIIEDQKISLLTRLRHYAKDYLVGKKREAIQTKEIQNEIEPIDEEDMSILRVLSKNAAIHILDLAKKTRLSINTVKDRMRKLEKRQVILGYRPFIDTEKSGYKYYKLHLNLKNYTKQDYAQIETFFELNNSTIYLTRYINGDDLEIEMHLENESKLLELKDEIIEKFGHIIKELYVLKFYKEHIFRYLPDS